LYFPFLAFRARGISSSNLLAISAPGSSLSALVSTGGNFLGAGARAGAALPLLTTEQGWPWGGEDDALNLRECDVAPLAHGSLPIALDGIQCRAKLAWRPYLAIAPDGALQFYAFVVLDHGDETAG
jgi:hypothetical protein